MSDLGVTCGHFQFSASAQGAESVLAGNGPSKRRGQPGIPTVNRTLRTDSPRLCTSHPQVCAQASPGLPRRQPRDCRRRRCQAAEPREARFMPTMGPLLPPQGATGQGGDRPGPSDSLSTPMIRPPPTSPSPTTGKDPAPAPHSFGAEGAAPGGGHAAAHGRRCRQTAPHWRCSPGPGTCRRAGRLTGACAGLVCRCDYPSRRQGGETMT
jgi:hypothetical protein